MTVDPQLTPEVIREFVIASHFNLDKVRAMFVERPALLTVQHQWGENDYEDGLGAASHVGNRPIAGFFLERGVPLSICAAAMLGRTADVAAFKQADPAQANAATSTVNPVVLPPLHFDGGSDDGIYDVYLKLERS